LEGLKVASWSSRRISKEGVSQGKRGFNTLKKKKEKGKGALMGGRLCREFIVAVKCGAKEGINLGGGER